ncbi:hypothetical protein SAMN05421666_0491 [Roseovarius nanhaiticus]|uniref:Uncharacterized protein n=1 Tax=Roseovarius nanhaiticus TaxID=573024 RepID=A0A1N7ES55_9RHOB|nr:hypothetical protein [Roseovarius nanhaiticus]SEK67635.1 hypothetical protein SAMN05216208_1644 [Roseovarius nanhaiticus]SIR90958.1 hypothetical protein SAMN05421666_0491 [Roseovarius nanhaiticus]
MSRSDKQGKTMQTHVMDGPRPATPNVDRPWDSLKEVFRRINIRQGDRATHRAYHSLYEDMLN